MSASATMIHQLHQLPSHLLFVSVQGLPMLPVCHASIGTSATSSPGCRPPPCTGTAGMSRQLRISLTERIQVKCSSGFQQSRRTQKPPQNPSDCQCRRPRNAVGLRILPPLADAKAQARPKASLQAKLFARLAKEGVLLSGEEMACYRLDVAVVCTFLHCKIAHPWRCWELTQLQYLPLPRFCETLHCTWQLCQLA